MTVLAKYAAYDSKGERCGGGSLQMPMYLDWFDIAVKAEWFKFIGQGPPETSQLVLVSQGQEKLISDVTLTHITYEVYKGRVEAAQAHINDFIDQGGYSREPRNQ